MAGVPDIPLATEVTETLPIDVMTVDTPSEPPAPEASPNLSPETRRAKYQGHKKEKEVDESKNKEEDPSWLKRLPKKTEDVKETKEYANKDISQDDPKEDTFTDPEDEARGVAIQFFNI